MRAGGTGIAIALTCGAGCGGRVAPTDGPTGAPPIAYARDGGSDGAPAMHATAPPVVLPPKKPPEKVRLFVHASPKAEVYWGKKDLGHTPLSLERVKDSGPMDLLVAAKGYFPVHVRAFTFRNDKIELKLVKLADRMSLFGARAEVEPLPDGATPAPTIPATPPPRKPPKKKR